MMSEKNSQQNNSANNPEKITSNFYVCKASYWGLFGLFKNIFELCIYVGYDFE